MTKEEIAKIFGVTVEDMDAVGPPAFEVAEKCRMQAAERLIHKTSEKNARLFRRLAQAPGTISR